MPKWRYACPYGHVVSKMGVTVAHCNSCGQKGRGYTFPKDDLYDLANGEEPPHA